MTRFNAVFILYFVGECERDGERWLFYGVTLPPEAVVWSRLKKVHGATAALLPCVAD